MMYDHNFLTLMDTMVNTFIAQARVIIRDRITEEWGVYFDENDNSFNGIWQSDIDGICRNIENAANRLVDARFISEDDLTQICSVVEATIDTELSRQGIKVIEC